MSWERQYQPCPDRNDFSGRDNRRVSELGSALRAWRDRLSAADAGLTVTARRRAPGLRREELAQLAGISVDYVTRLEQGRADAPSAQVLEALARALRLSPAERDHLFTLGRQPPRRSRMRVDLTPSVTRLLEQLQTPVMVNDALWNRLAWNRAFAVMYGDPGAWRGLETNLLWRYLTAAPTRVRRRGDEGDAYLRSYVADLRMTAARFPDDPRVRRLIPALHAASPRFGELWNNNTVGAVHDTHKTIEHPELGLLELDCDVLSVDGADLRIVLFTAAPGTAAADSLALLASLDVRPVVPMP